MEYHVYGEKRQMPETDDFQSYFDPHETAIVSIDMHEGHLSEDPECPCPAPRGRMIVDAIDEFHRAAREQGVPVIHVTTGLRQSGRDDVRGIPSAWRMTMPPYFGPIPGMDGHALEGSKWTQLRTEVDPRDELVTNKKRLTVFNPTDLDFLLRQMGVRTIVFTGIMTDCCVLSSSFDASNMNYRVVVPSDTTRGTDEHLENAALSIISLFLGVVVDSADLVEEWRVRASTTAQPATV